MKGSALLFGAGLTLVLAAALAAPVKAGLIFDTTSGHGREARGIDFMNGLYEGYVTLSESRSDAFDPIDGEHFNHKARRAARRSSVIPDEIMDRELGETDAGELSAALYRLRTAYERGGRYVAPADSATAQVSYDCWIEAAEGVFKGSESRRQDAEECRARFNDAMARVEELATYGLPTVAEAAPSPEAIAPPEDLYIVYFDFDRADVTAAAMEVLEQALAKARELGVTEFSITGHADRAGPEDYNLELSLRRANAVRDVLVEQGIPLDDVTLAGRGEAQPAVETEDGVREPANRRVEIIIL